MKRSQTGTSSHAGSSPAFRVAGRFLPRPGALSIALSVICTAFTAAYVAADVPGFTAGAATALRFLFALASVNALALVVLSVSGPVPFARRILPPAAVILLTGVMGYHLASKGNADPALVADNIALLYSFESARVVFSVFGAPLLFIWAIVSAAAVFLEAKFRVFSSRMQPQPVLPKAVVSLALLLLLAAVPLPQDELTLFAKQALLRGSEASATIPADREYPYIRQFTAHRSLPSIPSNRRRPNIILVMVESFSANFVEASSPEGVPYTPVYNSLISKGLYIDRFYGNSVQTCKGQEAVLFSILPSSSGKLFVNYPDTSLVGFPSVLAAEGYRTVFFQGYHDLSFDNTRSGMMRAGFDTIETFKNFQLPEDRPHVWGWGAEDSVFYKRFFNLLDREHAKSPDKPVFAALATIGTHIPCDGMPAERAKLYPQPRNMKEKYANALHLSDAAFTDLFAMMQKRPWLDNTIVVITADHSFPMREHGIYNNEVCSYEESFRIPFLMIWDGVIPPERVRERPYSQMDIAPTLLSLAGVKSGEYPFEGVSIFDRTSRHPVYLVQPYNGAFFEVVRWPLKYVQHRSTGEERLFDLAADPGEAKNLIGTISAAEREQFGKDIMYFTSNQAIIEKDRVWRREQ